MKKTNRKKFVRNLFKFVAPTLAIFFGQLALNVDWKAASGVALLAFYQALSDYLSKK